MQSVERLCRRLGLQILFDFSEPLDAVEFAAANGFGVLELNLGNIEFGRRLRSARERGRIRNACQRGGLKLAFHALEGPSFFVPSSRARRAAIGELKQTLRWADETGAMNVVMHLGFDMHYGVAGASRSTHEQFPDYYEQVLGEALAELKEYARGRARLCVENVGGFRYPPALVVLKRLLGGSLGLCLDTGHVGILPRERQRLELEFFEQHLTCLYHCHIHDNHGVRDEHLALGDGTLDLSRCFSMLERTDALLVFETRPKEEALRSRDFFERVAALKWMRPRSAAAGKSGRSHKQGGGQR